MARTAKLREDKLLERRQPPAFFSAQVVQSQRFYFDLAPPKAALTVICGGVERCAPNYLIRRVNGFPYLCLEYVADGVGALTMSDMGCGLVPGRMFAYGPGTALDMTTSEAHPLTKYFVCFAGTHALELLRAAGLVPGGCHDVFPHYSLVKLFEEMIEAGLLGGARGQKLCTALLRSLALKAAAGAAPRDRAGSEAFETYRRCRRHIEQRYLKVGTQAQLAEECRIDPSYLCRLFQIYDHQTPYQFLIRLKMHHAATQLQQCDISVKQAALTVGFADQLHFSRVFHKVLGVSPTALRAIR